MPSLPFDKLNETNYDDWKIQMEALLEEKGLFGVVSGRDMMPTTGPNSKGVRAFLEKQRLARSKIVLALETSQLPHIRNEQDPAIIWQNLAQIHQARGLGILLTLRRDFIRMTMPPDSTVAAFVANIRHAAYRLDECYRAEEDESNSNLTSFNPSTNISIVTDLDKISVLLNGLPPIYQPVIVNITGTPLASLTFENVVTRLLNEEGRLRNMSPSVTVTVPTPSTTPADEALVVSPPGGASRWKGKSQKSPPVGKTQVICHKCGGVGHFRTNCPTRDSDAVANAVYLDEDDEDVAFTVEPSSDNDSDGDV